MSAQAIAKGVKQSPRKVAVVASLVRGRTVSDALTILNNTPRRSALAVKKVILSAQANADHNHGYKPASLYIKEISVTPGPRLKRYKPASRGTALPFQKKSSHIKVVVDGNLRPIKPKTETVANTTKPATTATKKSNPKRKTDKESK